MFYYTNAAASKKILIISLISQTYNTHLFKLKNNDKNQFIFQINNMLFFQINVVTKSYFFLSILDSIHLSCLLCSLRFMFKFF